MRKVVSFLFAATLAFAAIGGSPRAQDQADLDTLNRQVEKLHAEGNDADARLLAERYVALARARYGEQDLEFATAISWLATIEQAQGRFAEAEALLKRALQNREGVLGPDHAQVASTLGNLAALYQAQGNAAEAEPLLARARAIRDKGRGTDELGAARREVEELHWAGKDQEALPLAARYVDLVRKRYGDEHPDLASALILLASIDQSLGRMTQAEALLKQALAIREAALGPKHREVVESSKALAALYRAQGRAVEVELFSAKARAIERRFARTVATEFAFAFQPSYAVIKVYYATDRQKSSEEDPARVYGPDRGELALGTCTVSIPRDHRMGALEAPSVWRLEWSEDPDQHVVLLSVTPTEQAAFYQDVAERVRQSAGRTAFVFVHGYNVTFADAARRTAQMAYDLGFDGAPVFYSWPSQASYASYTVDETNAEWSRVDLKTFLHDFAAQSGADNIFLIAHSMGTRVLTGALKDLLAEEPDIRAKIKEVILAAPDIDADTFKRDIAPKILTADRAATLYASSADYALKASKHFAGYRRAGDTAGGVTLVPGLDTIDASNLSTDFIGHSYYADSASVLGDLRSLILSRKRAEERGLKLVEFSSRPLLGLLALKSRPLAPPRRASTR